MEVLINLRRVERLDKDEFTEEERQEAEEIYEQRRAEEMAAEVGRFCLSLDWFCSVSILKLLASFLNTLAPFSFMVNLTGMREFLLLTNFLVFYFNFPLLGPNV